MATTSFITSLRSALEATPRPEGLLELWLFGSSTHSENPADVDILLVYDDACLDPRRARSVLDPTIRRALAAVTDRELDLVLLTATEEQELRFAERENALLVIARP
jgi:predicted nucleotidyltransferase